MSREELIKELKIIHQDKRDSYDSGMGSYDYNRGVNGMAATIRSRLKRKFFSEELKLNDKEWAYFQTEDFARCPVCDTRLDFRKTQAEIQCDCKKLYTVDRELGCIYKKQRYHS